LAAAFRGDLTADWRAQNPDVEPAEALLERIRVERRKLWEEAELEKMKAKVSMPKNNKWKDKYKDIEALDLDELPKLPDAWNYASAEELTAPGKSIIYGIIKPGPDIPDGIPYVRVTEMKTGTIDVGSLRRCSQERASKFSRATLAAGDILISKDGTIGKVALVPPELEGGNITQHVIRLSPSNHMIGSFIARIIESPFIQSWLTRKTKGIGLTGVNVEDFRLMPIPVPPLIEQKEILIRLEELLKRCEEVDNLYQSLASESAQIDQSILAKAFRGELVPQDPTDEPAALLLERIRAEREQLAGAKQKRVKGKR
jgi:type I restriction enzyme S subunit